MNTNTRKIVFTALFAAICCVATMFIKIPTPLGGYVNCGDAVVLLGAFLLGPVWGAVAAGIGSALADIVSGYMIYAPGTFIIKALMALVAAFLLGKLRTNRGVAAGISAVIAEVIMVLGYFVYEALPLCFGIASAANIPFNAVQGVFGAVASVALYLALSRVPYVKTLANG